MTLRPLSPGRYVRTLLVWAGVWVVVGVAAVLLGSQNIWAWDRWDQQRDVLQMRLYSVLTASVVGAALALAGLAFQALLRNPLASPYVLGVSGGGTLAVILASLFVGITLQPLFGFLGALATIVFVYTVAQRRGRIEPYTLLLSGVILNAFYAAAIMLASAQVPPAKRADIAYYMMGSISTLYVRWPLVAMVGVLAAAAAVVLAFLAKGFNLVALGEDTAGAMGIPVHRLRMATFVLASLVTGAAVSLAGPIGFVGLICPHILRMLLGPDHRRLVPASFFFGAAFLVLADLASRIVEGATGTVVPVGVLTAMCGGPFFVYLLRTRWRRTAEVQ